MLTASDLKGVLPAIPTLVHTDDRVDVGANRALVDFLLASGVDGIVPLGGTGEYGALARAERGKLAETVATTVNGRVPVVAGVLDTGDHDHLEARTLTYDTGAEA